MNYHVSNCRKEAYRLWNKLGGYLEIRKTRHRHKWRLLARLGITASERHYLWRPDNEHTRSCRHSINFVPAKPFKGFLKWFPLPYFKGIWKRGDK